MVIGIALRGLGKALLKKGLKKRGKDAASTFMKRRKVLRGASAKNKLDQDVKKTVKDVKKASERADKFSKDLKKKSGG
jgi:hypothetical protein